jgi:hypothetical protein
MVSLDSSAHLDLFYFHVFVYTFPCPKKCPFLSIPIHVVGFNSFGSMNAPNKSLSLLHSKPVTIPSPVLLMVLKEFKKEILYQNWKSYSGCLI